MRPSVVRDRTAFLGEEWNHLVKRDGVSAARILHYAGLPLDERLRNDAARRWPDMHGDIPFGPTLPDDSPSDQATARIEPRLSRVLGWIPSAGSASSLVASPLSFLIQRASPVVRSPACGTSPDAHGSMLLPKLVGSYEAELVAVIGAVVAAHPPVVVDLGAAEGYYAVGLARALPNAEVHAFELDEQARRACQRLADLNGVTVHLHGAASASALASVPLGGFGETLRASKHGRFRGHEQQRTPAFRDGLPHRPGVVKPCRTHADL